MIHYTAKNKNIIITGPNSTDAVLMNYIFVVFIGVHLLMFSLLQYSWLTSGIILLGLVLLFLVLRNYIRFEISLTPELLEIKKTFLFIPYLNIKWEFKKIRYDELSKILSFENKDQVLSLENFEGFEADCLLIVKNESRYEIGDTKDAKKIVEFLREGLLFLNL